MKKIINKRFAKTKEYLQTLNSIEKDAQCPFCKENFKYHLKKILKKKNDWFITENNWPYKNTKFHFLIIGEKHKENLSEITKEDFNAIKYLYDWIIKKSNIKGGALTIRFGDTELTGATVCHLHFHLISPKRKNKIAKTVNFPIG